MKDYNSVITAAGETDDTSVTRRVQNMENMTLGKTKSLSAVGITVKDDGTLALDKDTFAKADMSKVKRSVPGERFLWISDFCPGISGKLCSSTM